MHYRTTTKLYIQSFKYIRPTPCFILCHLKWAISYRGITPLIIQNCLQSRCIFSLDEHFDTFSGDA